MASNSYALGMREKGATVAASIGTALAIEALLGIYPDKPVTPAPLLTYHAVWINLATLFRNLYGSMTAADQRGIIPSELLAALKEDMAIVEQALKGVKSDLEVVFYHNTYKAMHSKCKNAAFRKPHTPNQLTHVALEKDTLALLKKYPSDADVRSGDSELAGGKGNAVVMTHITYDLLSRYHFGRLMLLESHTGNLKPASQWSTKLGVDKDDAKYIPFNTFTLQVFGDHATFAAQPRALRLAILKLAKHNHWTSVTTLDRIKASIEQTKDAYLMVATRPFL